MNAEIKYFLFILCVFSAYSLSAWNPRINKITRKDQKTIEIPENMMRINGKIWWKERIFFGEVRRKKDCSRHEYAH